MTNYLFTGLTGMVLIAAIFTVMRSCTKKGQQGATLASPGDGTPPDVPIAEKDSSYIDQQMAGTLEAKERQPLQGEDASPLPNQDYDFWRGETFLVDPAPCDLDDVLREVVRSYAASDPQQRIALRASTTEHQFYTLMMFAMRCAVFAVRQKDVEIARDGLTAVAMFDAERMDFRDIPSSLPLLYHAANRSGANADDMFRQVSRLADTAVAEQIVRFADLPQKHRSLRSGLFIEVQTVNGLGFARRGMEVYDPTLDLESLALAVARLIAADKYQLDGVSIESRLPRVWLPDGENAKLDPVLANVRGGARVTASLRPEANPAKNKQSLLVFLVETSDPDEAQMLLQLSRVKHEKDYCLLGCAVGPLFALLVANSVMWRVKSYETPGTLARFEEGVLRILADHVLKPRRPDSNGGAN